MTPVSADVWVKLSLDAGSGESMVARLAIPDVEPRVLAAIDSNGRRHILVRLEINDADVEDSQSRGISISTQTLNSPMLETARFIDLLCVDASGHAALDVIAGEIGERLSAGLETPAQCVSRVIAKWRRFWGAIPKRMLSREEQVGLFSELWFLLYWIVPHAGIGNTLAWKGPSGSRHDFEGEADSVEVKGTTSTLGPVHRISSLTQLDPPEKGALWFFSLQMREEAGAGNTLPNLIDLIRETLTGASELLDHFEKILEGSGYSPIYNPDYERVRWRIAEEMLFKVDSRFPRISKGSFSPALPSGVESLSYVVNLSAFRGLCVARSASQAWPVRLNSPAGQKM